MGNMGRARVARMMTWSLDKKRSCSTMHSTCLTLGMRPPSLPILVALSKPLHLCNVMLRMMSLRGAMHLWKLCIEVRGDSWGNERYTLLLFMMVVVVVDVMMVVVL